jgi:hypothetical protein
MDAVCHETSRHLLCPVRSRKTKLSFSVTQCRRKRAADPGEVRMRLEAKRALKPDVPFKRDFEHIMPDKFKRSFPRRMEEAIGTAFLKT